MAATILGSGIVFLDGSVVNVALPRIGKDLPRLYLAVLEGQSYVYNAYLLSLSALLILAGALNDYYGRRRMFALGLAGFGAASVLCGLAPNMEMLVAGRVLQGAFGALLVPGSLAIITVSFSGEEQGRAFGLWAAGTSATMLLGPFVGGLLVDTVSWRAAFLVNVPLVAVALYAVLAHVDESRDPGASGDFDWLGAAVVAVAVGGLSFGAIYGGQHQWHDPVAFGMLGLGALAAAAFPLLMRRRAHPLVPLSLFASRNFTVTNISTVLIYGALYVTSYYIGLFLQGTIGYSAAAAGLAGIAGSVLLVAFSARMGRVAGRYGPRWFMAAGPALMGLGVLWFARLPASSTPWVIDPGRVSTYLPPPAYYVDVLPGFFVFGCGLTIMVAPLTTALMTSLPSARSGLASAVNNAVSRVGPQLAGAVIFVAITSVFYASLSHSLARWPVHADLHSVVSPLNQPSDDVVRTIFPGGPHVDPSGRPLAAHLIAGASADSFHVAMLLSVALLWLGAAVNALGIGPIPHFGDEGAP
jgi:EmrB/QacA subfamily drug resistance transporter